MALSSGAPAPASSAATTAIRLNAEYLDTVLAALAHDAYLRAKRAYHPGGTL